MNALYPPPQSTMLMFDIPKCSGCGGPKTVNRILQDWGANHNWTRGRYEVLVNCASQRCSWNDCMIQLTLDEQGFTPKPKRRAAPKQTVSLTSMLSWTEPETTTEDTSPAFGSGFLKLGV